LAHRVLDATAWVTGSRVVGLAVQAVIVVTLARLLAPAAFGSYAVAVALTTFAALVGQLSLGPAMVRAKDLSRGQLSGAFWLLVASGAIGVVSVQQIAAWCFPPEIATIAWWCAYGVALQHLAAVPIARLQRGLRFRDYVVVELAAQSLGSGLVSIVAAWHGWGVWALVAGGLVRDGVIACGALIMTPPPVLAPIDRRGTMTLARYGVPLTFARLGASVAHSGPHLVVGRVLGSQALGFFARALFSVNRLELVAVGGLQNVLLAAFAAGAQDEARLRAGLLRSTRLLAAGVLPLFASLALVADDLVVVVLGPAWQAAGPLLQVASLMGACSSLATVADALLKASGRWRTLVVIQTTAAVLVLLAAWLGSQGGTFSAIVGVVGVLSAASLATIFATLWSFRVSMLDYLRVLAPGALLALLLGLFEAATSIALPASWNTPFGRLLFFTASGVACGAIALTWLKSHYAERTVGDYRVLAEWYRGHRRRASHG
jgi:O-antigen/teichoic acid export membrane protein